VGSVHEAHGRKLRDFPLLVPDSRPTDDSVLTVATADALLAGRDYAEAYRDWGRRHPHAGYGGWFHTWLTHDDLGAYDSNGSAMRVSAVGWLRDDADAVLAEAARSAAVTHSHPEGVKGAQVIALAVWLARRGADRESLRREIEERFGYDLSRPWEEVQRGHAWDVTCPGSVPPAIQAFLAADSFEDALRNAVHLGGDADTLACMAGAIAEPFFGGVPDALAAAVVARLPGDMAAVLARFRTAVDVGTIEMQSGS